MGNKKKVRRELELSCSKLFATSSSSLETALQELKTKLITEIDIFLDPENEKAKVQHERSARYLYDLSLPDIISHRNPMAVDHTRVGTFEAICMSLESRGVHNPADLKVYQFYKRIEIINTQKGTQ